MPDDIITPPHTTPTKGTPWAIRVPRWRLGINSLLLIVALYLALTQNFAFWTQVLRALPAPRGVQDYSLLASLGLALGVLQLLIMLPLSARVMVKPALMLVLIVASVCSYFMDSFGVVIDDSMLVNTLQTNFKEAGELLGLPMLLHVLLLGVVPAALISRVDLVSGSRLRELFRRLLLLVLALGAVLACVLANYKNVTLWARAHREVRLYANPSYPIYSASGLLKAAVYHPPEDALKPIATDATRLPAASGKPRVVIMVVGETARAANFQLAGYGRQTNPELAAIDGVISFSQAWSCGTATAVSVPCMFSRLGRSRFSRSKAREEENLLDVLKRTGVSVLWRDNNSDCKGVCARVPSEDLRHREVDGLCDAEGCHDEVLLQGLDQRIGDGREDQFIVLHLLGSHGPSYYKRYPTAFRKFTPDCAQDDVQSCTRESIVNAYDNTLLYTDHVLAELVQVLQRHADKVEPTLIYMSDHGESLGENGIYLHGLPYAVAPDEQKHVPFVLWSPARNRVCMYARRDGVYSHDNLFHTVLGVFAISTGEYHPESDILRGC